MLVTGLGEEFWRAGPKKSLATPRSIVINTTGTAEKAPRTRMAAQNLIASIIISMKRP